MIRYASFRRRRRSEPGINLTPLVDVMFHLMIFILVTAQYSTVYSMKVDLPKAESSAKAGEEELIVVTIGQDEKIYYEGDPISPSLLERKLKKLAKQKEPSPVIIKADQKSTTGILVKVMDLIKKVGLRKVSLQTEKS